MQDPSPSVGWTPIAWCLASAALFGASTPACKLLMDNQMGPLTLAGLLYLGAGLATLPFSLSGGAPERRRDGTNLRRLGGAVLFGGVLGPIALLIGLQTAPSASVSLWLNLETTATALLAWAFFREHLDARGWAASALVVGAGILLAAPAGFAVAPSAALILLACVFWGLDNNLTAVIDGFTPAQTTMTKGFAAGALNLLLAAGIEGVMPPLSQVLAALVVGALAYGASIVLYIRGAQQLGATRSQMLFATAPFLGVILAWLALGEPMLWVQLLAALIMAGALVLLFSGQHEHDHVHQAMVHTHAHCHDDDHHGHSHPDLPPEAWHTHEHAHEAITHRHPHVPDLHHRHGHAHPE